MHSAPAKVILFGEHAVVYGQPAIAIALEMRCSVEFRKSDRFMVNGIPLNEEHHRYIKKAIDLYWNREKPVNIILKSSIPPASGLGSSASITVATIGEIMPTANEETIAKASFNVEYEVQGRASPTDTSTVTHGRGIFIWNQARDKFLWKIERDNRIWFIHHLEIPSDLKFVVGYSGIPSSTSRMVNRVKKFVEKNSFGRDIINEIGKITLEALDAIKDENTKKIGELMNKNNALLTILGVNHPIIKEMIYSIERYCYGVKITGAGGGGSIIALTDEEYEVVKILRDRGFQAYPLKIANKGLTTLS